MADLLGSILGSMEKPPTASVDEKKKAKEHQVKLQKLDKEEKDRKEKFRKYVEKRITDFVNSNEETRCKMKPMNKLQRSIVHEMADIAGLSTQAFGREENDRYVMLIKKEHPLTEDEMLAYKQGETWSEERAIEIKKKKEAEERLRNEVIKSTTPAVEPTSNYKDKYNHLIGSSSALDAAQKTEANKSFGMVPSTNKRDQRSIEETLNEIRAKKKQKTDVVL
uniref:R3H domain-containing protein n=1 Tax=Ciona savignyi TaxID=51511 RepID=H2Z657_CIOSA